MRINRSITLLLAALAASCAELPSISPEPDQNELEGTPVQVARLSEFFPMYYSGFDEQARLVVSSQAEWEVAWRRLFKNYGEVPAVPAVDFEREVVLLAAMGTRSGGGHTVRVQQAASTAGQVAVRVIETSPGAGCITTAAITTPVDVVKLPRTSLPIEFQTTRTVHACD